MTPDELKELFVLMDGKEENEIYYVVAEFLALCDLDELEDTLSADDMRRIEAMMRRRRAMQQALHAALVRQLELEMSAPLN